MVGFQFPICHRLIFYKINKNQLLEKIKKQRHRKCKFSFFISLSFIRRKVALIAIKKISKCLLSISLFVWWQTSNNLPSGTHPQTALWVALKIAHLWLFQRNQMHGVTEKKSSTEQSMNLPAYMPRPVVLRPVCTLESPGKYF